MFAAQAWGSGFNPHDTYGGQSQEFKAGLTPKPSLAPHTRLDGEREMDQEKEKSHRWVGRNGSREADVSGYVWEGRGNMFKMN